MAKEAVLTVKQHQRTYHDVYDDFQLVRCDFNVNPESEHDLYLASLFTCSSVSGLFPALPISTKSSFRSKSSAQLRREV